MTPAAAAFPARLRPNRPAGRLASAARSPHLPLLLLLLALSTVFLFANDRGRFYRPVGPHDGMTASTLGMAANVSPEHDFLVFLRRTVDADGAPSYEPYNRFPIGGYLLLKLAIAPFDDDLSAKIHAARVLMLLFFVATVVLAWLSLCRLTSRRWIALTATLLTFSSTWWLYAADMVSNEVGLDFFGLMLVFHGMVIFAQEGRFRQLLAKTCVALLLGWHVYGLLLPFVVLGLVRAAVRARPARGPLPGARLRRRIARARPAATALLRSRHLALGVVALLFGMVVLSFNFAHEYHALDGERAWTELPSFQSMRRRLGLDEDYTAGIAERLVWEDFLRRQFHRIGGLSLPHALPGYANTVVGWPEGPFARRGVGAAIGIVVFCVSLAALAFAHHRMLLAPLVLSGFCWALPMRHLTFVHNFESLFYTGIPLVFFTLALLWLHRLFGDRLIAGLCAAALLVFVLSSFRMAHFGYDAEAAEFQEAVTADFEVIRRMTKGKTVFVPQIPNSDSDTGPYRSTNYYLAGSAIVYVTEGDRRGFADFVATREHAPGPALLTPENRLVFLYDRTAYDRQRVDELDKLIAEAGEPVGRSDFDLYRHEDRLLYAKDACRPEDVKHKFFLHLFPSDAADLPARRREYGFDNLDFHFSRHGFLLDGRCLTVAALPEYDVASIRTGQYVSGEGNVWEARFPLAPLRHDDAS